MFVVESGNASGAPVLLLHGGGVAGWMWGPLRDRLSSTYRLVIPDFPGHGQSAGAPYVSHDATIAALVAHLRGSRVSVIGFSLGAQLAVQLASVAPELVERVLVVSAQARPMAFSGVTLGLLGLMSPLAKRRWFAKLQARELFIPHELLESYVETSASLSKATLLASVGQNMKFVIPEGWPRFPGAALVLVGQRELRVMKASAQALHDALPGSELEVVDGCGHGIPFQKPDWFAERVSRWL